MPVETWLIFILCVMIVGSIVALEIEDILSAIIAVGIVGLGVSLSFLFLQAPDLAIVQFLFEIFAVVIMIRAFVGKEHHQYEPSGMNMITAALTIVVLVALLLLTVPVFQRLPQFGEPKMMIANYYIAHGAVEVGAANIVAAIILDYRAYDTMGEVTVLFTAILGTLSILRVRSKAKKEESKNE